MACPDSRAHVPVSAESEADTVGIEEILHDGSKGFLLEPTVRAGGLGMSSRHAPRQARNSEGHSSAGSRMTLFPTLLAITWSCSSPNRHDFGSRTAWLPPFWKILALSAMNKSIYCDIYVSS
jgi:hypothetical protein